MGRKALVIGIDNYQNSVLHGCVNDAKEIASLLKNTSIRCAYLRFYCYLCHVSYVFYVI